MKENVKIIAKALVTIGLIPLAIHWGVAGFMLFIPIVMMWDNEFNEEEIRP